jgi:hypothetical protein
MNEKLAISIPQFCSIAAIGRTTAFAEIKAGRLNARKRGRSTILLVEDVEKWLKALPTARAQNSLAEGEAEEKGR